MSECSRGKCRNVAANAKTGLCAGHYARIPHGYVDASAAIERFALLRARGLSQRCIADLAGLDRETLRRLGSWGAGGVEVDTHRKLMAVSVPQRVVDGGAAKVPAAGTRRRIQALMVAGHTQTQIGAHFGIKPQSVSSWLVRKSVTAATAAGVADLFDQLQLTPGTSEITAARAIRAGYLPAFAWDEDSVDDPTAEPDSADSEPVTWLDRYQELKELGVPESRIAERMGITQNGFDQQMRRLGIKGAA